MLPLLFVSGLARGNLGRYVVIPLRCNRRALSLPKAVGSQQCLSEAIFDLLLAYPSQPWNLSIVIRGDFSVMRSANVLSSSMSLCYFITAVRSVIVERC